MASAASVGKHPIHPMLIVFPIGLWVFSLVADIIYLAGGDPTWNVVAFYTMIGGTVGAAAAAIPGFIDYFSIKDDNVRKVATLHMVMNIALVTIYVINILQRARTPETTGLPIILSITGNILLVVAGWLGGHLVYVHGVAVECPPEERKS